MQKKYFFNSYFFLQSFFAHKIFLSLIASELKKNYMMLCNIIKVYQLEHEAWLKRGLSYREGRVTRNIV
jgi:hypothetical protein